MAVLWGLGRGCVVTASLFFRQDVVQGVFRKIALSPLEGHSLAGFSGTGMFCLSPTSS